MIYHRPKCTRSRLSADRAACCRPICIIGSDGTVNTGAVDDLNALADYANVKALVSRGWRNGAVAVLAGDCKAQTPRNRKSRFACAGCSQMDALPFEAGCVLVRHAEAHRRNVFTDSRIPESMNRAETRSGAPLVQRLRPCSCRVSFVRSRCGCRSKSMLERSGRMIARNVKQGAILWAGWLKMNQTWNS